MNISNFEPVYQSPGGKKEDTAKCQKCECTWFEQFHVRQLKANHTAILSQAVAASNPYEFVVIRCIKCGEKYQPNILAGAQDQANKLYNEFLDMLDTKAEEVKVEEPKKE